MLQLIRQTKVKFFSIGLALASVLGSLVAISSPANGWSEGGHHLISMMAFDQLSPEHQERFFEILSAHPDINHRRFEAPPSEETPRAVRRWQIGRVGNWPDNIRGVEEFDRPTWHYELGHALAIGDLDKLDIPDRPGPLPSDATMETLELYSSQAATLCMNVLASPTSTDVEKALALCWTSHLLADMHQPCHAGSLYMEGLFEDDSGDRGANSIRTNLDKNLHAIWDQLFSNRYQEGDTNRRMFEINSDPVLQERKARSTATPNSLNPQLWLAESRAASRAYVYTPEIIVALQQAARAGDERPVVFLSEEYLQTAGQVARARAIEGSARLAAIWTHTFDGKPISTWTPSGANVIE